MDRAVRTVALSTVTAICRMRAATFRTVRIENTARDSVPDSGSSTAHSA
ncbi:hypothetical protein [Streptomyces chartreusis]|nr:hypothetical protein OG938_02410 [Streptomyces chartreusis]